MNWKFLLLGPCFLVCFLSARNMLGQATNSAGSPPTPRQFFRSLNEHPGSFAPSSEEELLKVFDQIRELSFSEMGNTLPWILRALSSPNDEVKKYGAMALTRVGRRPDGPDLLSRNVSIIGGLLKERNDRLQAGGVYIFGMVESNHSAEIIPILIGFVNAEDRDLHVQAGALGFLARHAFENKEAAAAVKKFLSRSLPADVRVDALNALRSSRTQDYQIIDFVIAAIDDPDPGVRFTAVQVVRNLGRTALLQAEPALRKIVQKPDESLETKAIATEDLKQISQNQP